jgi:hypothetical protein
LALVLDALGLAVAAAFALPLPVVRALLPAFALEVPVVPLPVPFWVFRPAAAFFGFAAALRAVRAAVAPDAAGMAADMLLAATASDFTAVSIALVAELMACIAEAIDLAEVVAFVTASFSLVVAALTLAACGEMSRGVPVVLVLLVVATDLPSS